MRVFLEANSQLSNPEASYTGTLAAINRILLSYQKPSIMGATIVAPSTPDIQSIYWFVRERIQGIEIPNTLWVSLLKSPKGTLADIDRLMPIESNQNLIIMLPWEVIHRLHCQKNLGSYTSRYPRPDDFGNELAFLVGGR